jgi:glycosyltransferase involved in cell wall biosynthesis
VRPTLSVVVPACNEAESLPVVVPAILAAAGDELGELIIVDDGSRDATWTRIEELRRAHPLVVGLRLTRNFGHQAAILAGLAEARGDAVVMMDADGQHPPEYIAAFAEQWRRGFAVVQGVRTETDGEGWLKRATSRAFYAMLSSLGGPEVPAGSADFRLLSRQAVDELLASVGPLIFLRGLIPWLGFPTAYVPFKAERRVAGATKYTWFRMLRFSVHGILSFTTVPLRAATLLGLVVAAFSFAYLLIVLAAWLTSAAVVPGWASVMGLLSLLGGIQLVTIGLLGEYLGRVFVAQLKRPHFVIRQRSS